MPPLLEILITSVEEINLPGQSFRGFAEKVAVVTNGASGVGRAVALQLALQGAYVVVSFSEESEENSRAMQSLREIGTLTNAVEADVSTNEGIKRLFSSVEEMYGRLDLLVNCSCANDEVSFEELTEEVFQKTVDENLKSALFCSQAALSLMNGRPSPAIVNVAFENEKGGAHFAASKDSLIGLTNALSQEFSKKKIRVNCVVIGSELKEKTSVENSEQMFVSSPFDDAARAVVYLLSSEAKAVKEQTIVVK